jgi:hypothetical protein
MFCEEEKCATTGTGYDYKWLRVRARYEELLRSSINHWIKPQNTVDGLANQDWNVLDVSMIICGCPQAFSFAMVSDVLSSTLSLDKSTSFSNIWSESFGSSCSHSCTQNFLVDVTHD